jgi:uncharacterized membrane protein YhaH (DUF805 family)
MERIAAAAVERLLGRILRRAMLAMIIAVLAIVAIYQFTVAGTLALDAHYGAPQAHLIIGAIYAVITLVIAAVLWATRLKPAAADASPALSQPRELQMAMLVEAVMLGYALARKGERAH